MITESRPGAFRSSSLPVLGLVVPSLEEGGGVPAVARFLADAAVRSGRFSPSLISLSTSARDPTSLLLTSAGSWARGVGTRTGEWNGYPFVHVGAYGGEVEFMRYQRRAALRKVVQECDVIQVVCGFPAWANAVVGYGKPVSVQCATRAVEERRMRDRKPRTFGAFWRKAMTQVTDRMDDRALRAVQAVQVENPWMLRYVRELNSGRSIDVRYATPGVDEQLFRPAQVRGFSDDPYILCVGRVGDPRKNIDLLLRAYAKMRITSTVKARLVIAGSSQPAVGFWELANQLGVGDGVSFVHRPSREELVSLYQNAAVFALPSDEEGLGIVLLEAMACGVPVVSTRSGGPDGIIHDGFDGFLVPRGDASALGEKIGQLLRCPVLNQAMGAAGRMTIERRYAEGVTAQIFVEIWNDLFERSMS